MTVLFLHYFSNKYLEFNLLGLLPCANNLEIEKHSLLFQRLKNMPNFLIRAFLHTHTCQPIPLPE